MSRATMSRIARLEAVKASAKGSNVWHQVIGDSDEKAYAAQAALIASGQASPEDNFIHRIVVTPPVRADDWGRLPA
jgi:hypothetical protein